MISNKGICSKGGYCPKNKSRAHQNWHALEQGFKIGISLKLRH